MLEILGADLGNLDTVTDCYGYFVIIYSINYALVFMRLVMGKKLGSKKVKPMLDKWAARGQPTAGFRDC